MARDTQQVRVLPFPSEPHEAPEAPPRCFVETQMAVGGVRLVYLDGDGEPRLALVADAGVPDEDRRWLARAMKIVGDKLPPLRAPRPLLGPRLLP